MRAIFSGGGVPLSRVLREHRSALLPLAVVLAINLIVLVAVVLPLSQRAASNEARAAAATAGRSRRRGGVQTGRSVSRRQDARDGRPRDVLPRGAAGGRRRGPPHHPLQAAAARARAPRAVRARRHDEEETIDDSSLERQTVTMTLSGDYDDIRAFIYTLETSRRLRRDRQRGDCRRYRAAMRALSLDRRSVDLLSERSRRHGESEDQWPLSGARCCSAAACRGARRR